MVSSGNELPEIQKIDASGVNEETQGELVTIEKATITELAASGTYGTFEFKAEDTEGKSVIVRHDNRTGSSYEEFVRNFKVGDVISVTGIGSKFNDTYQLKPRGIEDYELVNKPAVYTDIFLIRLVKIQKYHLNLAGKKRKSIIRWMEPHRLLQVPCTQNRSF